MDAYVFYYDAGCYTSVRWRSRRDAISDFFQPTEDTP